MIDIILFAGIAAFIGVRLYNALGRKDFDHNHGKAPVVTPAPEKVVDAKYVVLKPVVDTEDDAKLDEIFGKELAKAIRKVRAIDPSFSALNFLNGAKKAFEVILKAFGTGDKETLKPLLTSDVYNNFSSEIDERANSGNITENTLIAILSATIKDITVHNKYVRIAIQIVSEQVSLIKDKQGKIVEGDPSHVEKIDEIWIFGRDFNSASPNWELIETSAA